MPKTLKDQVRKIVSEANKLKNKHTSEKAAKVNYAAIFCQTKREYDYFLYETSKIGRMIVDSESGPLFHINKMQTVAGPLKILKIRKPHRLWHEMGDADFTVKNYSAFKKKYKSKPQFAVLKRKEYEMVELVDKSFDVRAYFSNKPIDKELGI